MKEQSSCNAYPSFPAVRYRRITVRPDWLLTLHGKIDGRKDAAVKAYSALLARRATSLEEDQILHAIKYGRQVAVIVGEYSEQLRQAQEFLSKAETPDGSPVKTPAPDAPAEEMAAYLRARRDADSRSSASRARIEAAEQKRDRAARQLALCRVALNVTRKELIGRIQSISRYGEKKNAAYLYGASKRGTVEPEQYRIEDARSLDTWIEFERLYNTLIARIGDMIDDDPDTRGSEEEPA